MPYCQRCGMQLEEDAHFCHRCGTQVAIIKEAPPTPNPVTHTNETPPTGSPHKDSTVLIAIGLVVILVLAMAIVIFFAMPIGYWNMSEQSRGSNVNKLDANFEINICEMNSALQNARGEEWIRQGLGNALSVNGMLSNQPSNKGEQLKNTCCY